MSLHDEHEIDDLSHINDLTDFEQFLEWCKVNKKVLSIAITVMLIHTMIFLGTIISINTGSKTDNSFSEAYIPPPPIVDIDEPVYSIDEPEDPSLSAAYDAGIQAGELLNESIDTVVDFWHGFNEATGATTWAREKYDSSKERLNLWIVGDTANDD